jgi:hypothetical protein
MNHKNAVLQGLENMKEFDGYGTGILFYDDNGNAFTIN